MELTAGQLSRLRKAHQEIETLLAELGVSGSAGSVSEPKWRADVAKQWALLVAVGDRGGDLSPEEWGTLGARFGYDPRGLGGFFRGREQRMEARGERRVLSEYGRRFIERWAPDFAPIG